MNRKNTMIRAIGGLVTASILLTSLVLAAPAEALATASPQTVTSTHSMYSDVDVTSLLVFGRGRMAEDNPELASDLNAGRSFPKVTASAIASFTHDLQSLDPDYHEVVGLGVQKGDPYAARAALHRVSDDIAKWYDLRQVTLADGPQGVAAARGVVKQTAVVATTVAGGWQVLAFTTVAVVGEAVLVVAIVPAAVSYRFTYTRADRLQIDGWSAHLASMHHEV